MALFIAIVLIVFTFSNFYVISRGYQMLEALGRYRWIYVAAFVLLALTFLAGMIFKRGYDTAFTETLWRIGSWWIVVMLYSFLAILCFDLIRLVLLLFGKKLSLIFANYAQVKLLLSGLFTLVLLVLIAIGYRNGKSPEVKTLPLTVHKNVPDTKELNIVAISDLHLGTVYTERDLQKWVTKINDLQPDIVFLVGDTFDDNPTPVIRRNMGVVFEQLNAPLGIYAVTGNHELFADYKKSMNYLAQHGVQPLMDSVMLVADKFYVVGRIDRSINARGTHRKTMAELTTPLDKSLPIIVLDHQPYEWDESAAASVDIQLAGHTHAGQLWPFNYITRAMYQQHWGYLQKGASHFYTSCGIGDWGPPIRIGSRSEIVQLKISFN